MYQYNDFDRQFVNERVAHYRDQTQRYLNGDLSEDEFLQLRLRNGLYIQRLAPMLRVAIPYGTLSTAQLRALASIANTYDRGYGHLSTRQNMQFNWPEIADVPDILEQLAAVNMHAIQTSGSCIRNVTTDHFAGAAADESIDPRPYCELIRQWSTLHPEFEWLPRKFKIAVSGGKVDRAAIDVHDIGLRVYEDAQQPVFDVIVGGGLGRTPVIGTTIRKGLPAHHLLTYPTCMQSCVYITATVGATTNTKPASRFYCAHWVQKPSPNALTRNGNRLFRRASRSPMLR